MRKVLKAFQLALEVPILMEADSRLEPASPEKLPMKTRRRRSSTSFAPLRFAIEPLECRTLLSVALPSPRISIVAAIHARNTMATHTLILANAAHPDSTSPPGSALTP